MMETTTNDRQQSLRSDIYRRLDHDEKKNHQIFLLLGLVTVLSIAVQFSIYLLTHPNVRLLP
jgi:hypothetical protein